MIKQALIGFGLLLSACTQSHDIKIVKEPCLYPHKNYDFTLCEDFIFSVDGEGYLIHQGFTTDLASVPRIFWSFYSPMKTDTIPGAVIHDYFYFCPDKMSRKDADDIFYYALLFEGVSRRTAYRYWMAVRTFGGLHFNQGATCTHGYTRTKNSAGDMRVALETTPKSLQKSLS